MTTTRTAMERLRPVLKAEWEAGVQPTYEWMNFYGKLALPDGTGAPTGTVVLAVDPQGVICGATATWEAGQYGLLACYRDDPDTAVDEGAVPGDTSGWWWRKGRRRSPAVGSSAKGRGRPTAPASRCRRVHLPSSRTRPTCRCCSGTHHSALKR